MHSELNGKKIGWIVLYAAQPHLAGGRVLQNLLCSKLCNLELFQLNFLCALCRNCVVAAGLQLFTTNPRLFLLALTLKICFIDESLHLQAIGCSAGVVGRPGQQAIVAGHRADIVTGMGAGIGLVE